MRSLCLFLLLALVGTAARGQEVVVTTIVTAQQQAEVCARTGRLTHCRVLHGRREGIGYGPTPEAAEQNACFYKEAMRGRYRIVERGVARGPRGWYAVLRYAD